MFAGAEDAVWRWDLIFPPFLFPIFFFPFFSPLGLHTLIRLGGGEMASDPPFQLLV
jgi:hypothetical protein